MGNYLDHTRPLEQHVPSPAPLKNVLTDMTGFIGHHVNGPCRMFNLKWMDCVEAYGAIQGGEKCKYLWQDFCECGKMWKRTHRMKTIKDERDRQWLAGILGTGPRVPMNHPHVPDYDTFLPDFVPEEQPIPPGPG